MSRLIVMRRANKSILKKNCKKYSINKPSNNKQKKIFIRWSTLISAGLCMAAVPASVMQFTIIPFWISIFLEPAIYALWSSKYGDKSTLYQYISIFWGAKIISSALIVMIVFSMI